MKKSYIIPAIEIVNVAPTTVLAASKPGVSVNWDADAIEAGSVEVKSYSGRAGSVDWDDDWSE